MLKEINQETLVPLGLAIAIIGGITSWAVEMKSQVRSHAEVIEALKTANDSQVKVIFEINARLSRIEWKLEKDVYVKPR